MLEPDSFEPRSKTDDPNADHHGSTSLWDYQISTDPLLESGTFICTNNENRKVPNGAVDEPGVTSMEPSSVVSNGGAVSQEKASSTPTAAADTYSTPTRSRSGGATEEMNVKRPEWLPVDWKMEVRVRVSGQTAGTCDRLHLHLMIDSNNKSLYYVEPVSGCKFRSKNEVLHFLETGSKRKRKNAEAETDNAGSGGDREKKSASKLEKPEVFYFDFENAPQKVTWVLSKASPETWMPYINDVEVPEKSRRQWAAVISHVSQLKKSAPAPQI